MIINESSKSMLYMKIILFSPLKISNGAEILMLDKEYFLKHANDEVRTNIRRIIQNYPPREEMQSKLQVKADWKQYKKKTLQDLYTNINIQKAHKNSKSFF